MSAGQDSNLKVSKDLNLIAPHFREAVEAAIAECAAAGLDAMVYEAYRSQALQAVYYARGRTVKPPNSPVTNAPTNRFSWHGFGLAVDVVHRTKFWNPDGGNAWFARVAEVFKRHGCAWGGDWTKPDLPHFQWGLCKPSPSDRARQLLDTGGVQAVWIELGAA
jgi:peptidoglycan L-alanyl-D-glutamate endopeptidase CwlK